MAERADSRRLRAWLAASLWTALILTFSGDSFSAASTSRILGPILRWLLPDVSPQTLESIHLLARKGAHAFEYGLLALLILRAELLGSARIWVVRLARVLALTAAVASVDEIRQARLGQRTGSAVDVGIDLAGAVAALALALGVRHWTATRRVASIPSAPAREIE